MTQSRVVIVTGASSGIGRAVAHRSAARGDAVVLAARGVNALEEVAVECRGLGAASVLVVPTDVGDDAAVRTCMRRAVAEHGRIDAVVHCAGVVAYGRTEDVPAEVFESVLTTNLIGSVNVARHAVTLMRSQDRGSLVLLGSVIGHIAVPNMSAYVLSKWGVRALARQLHIENRDKPGVSIAYIAPGGVDTPIYEQAANYQGFVGRPPPPVETPEAVARTALRLIDRPRPRVQTGLANDIMRLGFTAVPWAFDALVSPLFALAATDLTRPVAATTGNVLRSLEAGNRLRGSAVPVVSGLARNLMTRLKA